MGTSTHRRRIVLTLGVSLVLLFLALATLNAFNLRVLNPETPAQTLVFIALSTLAFLLFVGVLIALVRNVLKLYSDQRSRVLGTRLRTRMLWGAVLVSIAPLVFMFAFSYLLLNRAVDRWFSQPVTEMRNDANSLTDELLRYASANARSEADSIAVEIASDPPQSAAHALQRHEVTLQGGFAVLYREGNAVTSLHLPDSPATTPASLLQLARRTDDPFFSLAGTDYTLATAALSDDRLIIVGLPIPQSISTTSQHLRASAEAYWTLFRERRQVRNLYMFLLLLTTMLALFACCWLALNLSKQVTRPIESLADAMEAIASGNYAHRVSGPVTQELGELVDSFNAMAADLESARVLANQSTSQLSELNTALQARRRELETIIETIPNGVATFNANRHLLLANRAFSELLDPGGQLQFLGIALEQMFPPEITEALDRLLRRSHRMGSASTELEMATSSGPRQLSATVALLEDGLRKQPIGYVVVLENATELLRAQKQSAWKEVARRVAHEIKNPLTPISLNAEQIRRHIVRLATAAWHATNLGVTFPRGHSTFQ
ncbi:MAG: HAMP domain-containing protein [Micavibrio sp.]|nr:HAMP domain-containing protein [Micavibrio sp.]